MSSNATHSCSTLILPFHGALLTLHEDSHVPPVTPNTVHHFFLITLDVSQMI